MDDDEEADEDDEDDDDADDELVIPEIGEVRTRKARLDTVIEPVKTPADATRFVCPGATRKKKSDPWPSTTRNVDALGHRQCAPFNEKPSGEMTA